MRIVGGRWRGRPLEAPDGRWTRPTSDRVREQIASMALFAFDLDLSGVSVLDAFAGSGAVGLELLSRGAARCTFVDRDRDAIACVRRNVARLGAPGSSCPILSGDVMRLAARGLAGAPFSLVVLDPPYALPASDLSLLMGRLRDSDQLADGARVLYERASAHPPLDMGGARTLRSRAHGITAVDLLRIGGPDD